MPHVPIAIPAACCLAVAAFAVAMISGMGTENTISSILQRALIALVIVWPIGFALGKLIEYLFASQAGNSGTVESEALVDAGDTSVSPDGIGLDEHPDESDGRGSVDVSKEATVVATTPP